VKISTYTVCRWCGRKPVGKNHLEDLDIYEKIILKCIVKKRDWRERTIFIISG